MYSRFLARPTTQRARALAFQPLTRSLSTLPLNSEERTAALQTLSQKTPFSWKEVDGRNAITKTYEFADFEQAWSFMSKTAVLAETMNHHPEWFNVYNRVEVTLTTHDCGGVSQKDIDMATSMEDYANEILPLRS
mmetsp:Transcript_46137/g.68742  ORF Transcript_46137/g.68742 Transcript_46137/m.68742 type:complete len:135 (-) Transcript_46137:963-1367(-)